MVVGPVLSRRLINRTIVKAMIVRIIPAMCSVVRVSDEEIGVTDNPFLWNSFSLRSTPYPEQFFYRHISG